MQGNAIVEAASPSASNAIQGSQKHPAIISA